MATIVAVTVEVHCPHCGDPQPNAKDGSHLWLPQEVEDKHATKLACAACSGQFWLLAHHGSPVIS